MLIPRYTRWNLHWLSLFVDAAAVLIVGFLPQDMDNMLALYPFFFATAFQWCSFQGGGGYVSATIFSTNNMRQFVASAAAYLCGHEQKMKEKAQFFGYTLLFFHAGVAAGWPAYQLMGIKSSWLGFIPLAAAGWLVAKESGLVGACGLTMLSGPRRAREGRLVRRRAPPCDAGNPGNAFPLGAQRPCDAGACSRLTCILPRTRVHQPFSAQLADQAVDRAHRAAQAAGQLRVGEADFTGGIRPAASPHSLYQKI